MLAHTFNTSIKHNSHKSRCAGFSMVETLVSLLVLSIGLLGVAGLQVSGMKANQSAYIRSQATLAAYDMIDRMRTNPDGVTANHYNSMSSASLPNDPNCVTSDSGCTAAALAANDLREWTYEHLSLLSSGSGTVTKSGSVFTVSVNWVDPSETTSPNKSISINFQM